MESVTLSTSPSIVLYHGDCQEFLEAQKNKAFDWGIVDPPYGLGFERIVQKDQLKKEAFQRKDWDDKGVPGDAYFGQLRRVTKEQIIWGANYFKQCWPAEKFICWHKHGRVGWCFSQAEIASLSRGVTTVCKFTQSGAMVGTCTRGGFVERFHPTQKPVELYSFLIRTFLKPGETVLDTHLGSGTNAVACYLAGLDFVGVEKDPDYFRQAQRLFKQATAQQTLF